MIFQREDVIKELLGHLHYEVPMIIWWREARQGIGPCNPTFFTDFEERRREAEDRLVAHLDGMTNEDLSELFEDSQKQKHLRWELKLPIEPEWYSGGVNVLGSEADFSYWARMEYWTNQEACCLSIGFNPQEVNGSFRFSSKDSPEGYYYSRLEMIKRWSDVEGRGTGHSPAEFCEWALKKGIEVNTGLLQAVADATKIAPAKDSALAGENERRFENREKSSLATLVVAMAIDAYGYDPLAARSPIPKEIQSIADRLGLEISLDTIRKYLKLGAKKLPSGFEPE